MNFKLNAIYNGFKLLREEKIEEIESIGRIFIHEKSGARLISLANDDDNKVFSISFKTIPKDDTGVAHILEHSTLCGSRKFPTKEPFLELMKSSLNTFLNAMTSPDKTTYPVASKNEKDFFNLMDVYLDAVFYPNIYKYPEIFMQEGWHYELENREAPIKIKGVVYNEMKGALSSPERILGELNQHSLFPDNTYRFNAGGVPEHIPELSYEAFLDFHKKYYHPSNSYILLYGNGDLEKQLKFINDNYLNNFDKTEVDTKITEQKPFKEQIELEDYYPISEKENEKDKTYLSMNFTIGKAYDSQLHIGMSILKYMLFDSSAAPLKKALIEANIGKDIFSTYEDDILQPYISIVCKNSDSDKKDKFKNIIYDSLKNLAENGIDKKLKTAAINIIEFMLREADYRGLPKGLVYDFYMFKTWMHDKDPFQPLQYNKYLSFIKKNIDTYFEDLIKEHFLNNTHSSIIILKPQKGLAEKKNLEEAEKLKKIKDSLLPQEIDEIISNTKKLIKRQQTPDSKEAIASIPHLKISDIKREISIIPSEKKTINNTVILHQPIKTNGIVYLNMMFDASVIDKEQIQYLSLLAEVLGQIDTKKHDYTELSNLIDTHLGGIEFSLNSYGDFKKPSEYHKIFSINAKVLKNNTDKLMELATEIMNDSLFDNKKRLEEIIRKIKSRMEMYIMGSGHKVAALRLHSHLSQRGKFDELTGGIEFYKFISSLEKSFDKQYEIIRNNLQAARELIFNRNNLTMGIVAPKDDYNAVKGNIADLIDNIKTSETKQFNYSFELSRKNEALLAPLNVQFVTRGNNYTSMGYKWSGKYNVLVTLVARDYLWNNIRVMGGAYGTFMIMDRFGEFTLSSYRDPNLTETLNTYKNLPEYIKNITLNREDLTKYIIGTIGKMDAPLTPSMKGKIALSRYISNITNEELQKERDEVLSISVDDIKNSYEMLNNLISSSNYCAMGNEGKLKENKDIFDKLIPVFE